VVVLSCLYCYKLMCYYNCCTDNHDNDLDFVATGIFCRMKFAVILLCVLFSTLFISSYGNTPLHYTPCLRKRATFISLPGNDSFRSKVLLYSRCFFIFLDFAKVFLRTRKFHYFISTPARIHRLMRLRSVHVKLLRAKF